MKQSMKKCLKCGRKLPLDKFAVKDDGKTVYRSPCKDCRHIKQTVWYDKKIQPGVTARARVKRERTHKVCTVCGVDKPLDQFVKRPRRPDGRDSECKSCHTARNLQYYHAHKDVRLNADKFAAFYHILRKVNR